MKNKLQNPPAPPAHVANIDVCKLCSYCTFRLSTDKKYLDPRCHYMSTCGTPLSILDECPVITAASRVPAGKAGSTDNDAADRYTWRDGIECREIQRIMAWGASAEEAPYIYDNVKYLYRYPRKGGSKDIRKAIKCLEELAEVVEAHERS
ncbi:hypothetical protein [Acidaminococcus massiliensis]|uniref:hypothetical protein n=1 Tax=Acidaminococcus massiliensis TaxID=1852375 RepID=UPI0009F3D8E4|nr:hypothetical protein [Acidaminococcus massiliensis]